MKTICSGTLKLGDAEFSCAVLEDKTRVVSERSMTMALGGTRRDIRWRRKATAKGEDRSNLPAYLSSKNLQAFIDSDLQKALLAPKKYHVGSSTVNGMDASLIPNVCEVYLKARDANALHKTQMKIAVQADILIRSLAKVGVIALVDEATGYDKIRGREELERLLGLYLSEERLKWAKMFPDEFYQEIYRLRRWSWPPKPGMNRHPSIVGKITNEIVYSRLPDGVLEKLQEKNPIDVEKHRRNWKHTQFLSEGIGKPSLSSHLNQVIALLKASANWNQFQTLLNRAFPRGRGVQLTFDDVA